MSIGAFARLAGLTTSALRFYDDAGVLRPESVDPMSGYRFYSESQVVRASQLRQMRAMGMPLTTIGRVFAADVEEAVRMIDAHLARVATGAARIRQAAVTLEASLAATPRLVLCELAGPVLAAAVDQVLATTVDDPERPVLGGVRLEADPDAISLTSTDRYRLSTRTLVPAHPSASSWAGTLTGEDLKATASRLRRSPMVTLEAGERTLGLRFADGSVAYCRLLAHTFPEYRLLIRSLAAVTHRVTVAAPQLLKALEHQAPERVGLHVAHGRPRLLLAGAVLALDGSATGPDLTIWFELTTLYPALSHVLGSEVMLDLRGADQPATVRSADDGDLTVLVMPCPRGPATTGPS